MTRTSGVSSGFERGFKSWCENTSESIRVKMGLMPHSPLAALELAKKLDVEVWNLSEVPGLSASTSSFLSSEAGNEWSAVTVQANGRQIVVLNPRHSDARRSSTLMHELAHVIRQHPPAQAVTSESGFVIRVFEEKQEAEADWLAGTLLLPRAALAYCSSKRIPVPEILAAYNVSNALYGYRMRMTGVSRQFARNGHGKRMSGVVMLQRNRPSSTLQGLQGQQPH